jgi:hypothetical protein
VLLIFAVLKVILFIQVMLSADLHPLSSTTLTDFLPIHPPPFIDLIFIHSRLPFLQLIQAFQQAIVLAFLAAVRCYC